MINLKKYHLTIEDKKAKMLVNICLKIAFAICLFSLALLLLYNKYYISINLFKSSLIVFRIGLLLACSSVIYGIFFNNIEYIK